MPRILLATMPFGNLRWPNLGLGLLKAALARRHIPCDVAYFNFDFAERVGLEHYHWLADHFAFVLGGERLFAKHYFRDRLPADADYYREVLLAADPTMSEADHAAYLDTDHHIEPFLDQCAGAVDWSLYDAVGFTASFQQTMPSLCLAQRIKQLRPEMTIVLGGAACEGRMGEELLAQFPEIDCVFSGEADRTFPEIDCVFSGEADRTFPETVEKWIHEGREKRGGRGKMLVGWESGMVENLDELPFPDFDDYFARLKLSSLRNEIDPLLFFETSRGCWWGKKCRCKFCGLNGDRLGFRSKSPARVVDELRHLVDRYGVHRTCAADNILDPHYFDSLLPMLASAGLDLSLSFEMKTNLTRQQVEILCQAGLGAAQLGVESFSTPILKLIGKGATAMQNVQTLRWFSEAGVEVKWNLLYGFPGEDPAEYAKMAALLPSLYHLAPPQAVGRVRVDRFAPYFDQPEQYGIVNLRPSRCFSYVYPFSSDVLSRLAYYFDYEYADGRDPMEYARPLIEAGTLWQQIGRTVSLCYWDRPDGVLILTDTRPEKSDPTGKPFFQQWRMTGIERAVYLFCDTARTLGQIMEYATAAFGVADPSAIERMLDDWATARLTLCLDDRYLSLAKRKEH